MKKILLALPLLGLLAACGTTSNIEDNISSVQSYTKTICKFVPTVATVAKIISTSLIIDSASGIAAGICAALATAPLADGPGKSGAYYSGVRIEGRYVK